MSGSADTAPPKQVNELHLRSNPRGRRAACAWRATTSRTAGRHRHPRTLLGFETAFGTYRRARRPARHHGLSGVPAAASNSSSTCSHDQTPARTGFRRSCRRSWRRLRSDSERRSGYPDARAGRVTPMFPWRARLEEMIDADPRRAEDRRVVSGRLPGVARHPRDRGGVSHEEVVQILQIVAAG